MRVDFFSSAFCDPCIQTRHVLAEVGRIVPTLSVLEHDVAVDSELAETERIRSTPTVIVRGPDDREVFRAEGVPSVNHVLVALAKAVE